MPTPYDPNNPLVKVNNMTDIVTLRWGTEDKVGELEVGITSDSYLRGEFQSNRNLLPYIILVLLTGILLILVLKKWI